MVAMAKMFKKYDQCISIKFLKDAYFMIQKYSLVF